MTTQNKSSLYLFVFLFSLYPTMSNSAPPKDPDAAVIKTNVGKMAICLFSEQSPLSVTRFREIAQSEGYKGTIFHRVIAGFMAQGGGYNKQYQKQNLGFKPIMNESDNGLKNDKGTLAFARTRAPHSATSQFYINLADNPHLNYREGQYGYAVFGEVVSGMDTLEKIAEVAVKPRGRHRHAPVNPIIIDDVKTPASHSCQ